MYGAFVEVRGQPSDVRPHLPSPFETGYRFVFLPFACAVTSLSMSSGTSPASTSHFAVGYRCHTHLYVSSGVLAQVLVLVWQALYPLRHHPSLASFLLLDRAHEVDQVGFRLSVFLL